MPRQYRRYRYLGLAADQSQVTDVTDQYEAEGGVTAGGNTVSSDEVAAQYSALQAIQATVQQDAPQLSSQWGWLVQQGQLIIQGGSASLSWLDFVTQSENLIQAASAAARGVAAGIVQQHALAPAAPPPVGCSWYDLSCNANKYLPWIIGAVVLAIAVPAIISAVRK